MKSSLLALGFAAALFCTCQPSFAQSAVTLDRSGSVKVADTLASPKQIEEAVRAGNWTQAEAMLNGVLKAKPDSAKAWYWMAQTQEKLNQPSKAQMALSKAEKLQPDLKFASPGAVAQMRGRLAQVASSTQPKPQAQLQNSGSQAVPGYAGRPAVGTLAPAGSAVAVPEPEKSSGHSLLLTFLALMVLGGGGFWFFHKRAKQKLADDHDRERKLLLGRANSVQERATTLVKTARFEGQESSAFGVAAASAVSRANSALSRLKSVNATFDVAVERRSIETMEDDIERLENQGTRKAWAEEPPKPAHSIAPPTSNIQAPGYSTFGGHVAPTPGYVGSNPGYSSSYAGSGPHTVVVNNQGGGLLETMIVANALNGSHHHHSDREYDLERENRHLRNEQRHASYAPAPAPEPAQSSSFDLGGGSSSSWDSGSSAPSFDSGSSDSSSSSSSWDSGSSSSSSFDSGSSDSSSSWDSGSSSSNSSSSSGSSD